MKIAQVAPLFESVPPRLYGGTERIVSYLTEELINLGHEVTLFASGDSITRARLRPVCEQSLRLNRMPCDHLARHILLIQNVFREAHLYDIIHFHIDFIHYPLARLIRTPQITTLHGRQDIPDLQHIYREFFEIPVVSISDSQRNPLPGANWQATVYNGIPEHAFTLHQDHEGYLAFLGRTSPNKGIEEAIRIAVLAGLELRIAAKIDEVDKDYFNEVIQPLLNNPSVHFIGEINEQEKNDFLGNARALLFPVKWPEPFGLVVIEAMACGTPAVAFNQGAVPEIIEDGKTGFIVDDVAEALEAVHNIDSISRLACRNVFKRRFSSKRMAREYVKIYQKLLDTTQRRNVNRLNKEENYGRRYSDQRQMVYSGNLVKGG